jgi:hypothetical protein
MNKAHAVVAAGVLLCLISVARADPADEVVSPIVEQGERELELKFGTQAKRGEPRFSAATLGIGYGVLAWWAAELELKYEREGAATRFDAIELEHRFQLTETGKYPLDLGFLFEIEWPRDRAEGWEFVWGPLLQAEAGRMQYTANLLWARHVRSDTPSTTELGYRLEAKYRWHQALEFGAQAFGDLGPWRRWSPSSDQSHRIGPALFGKLRFAPGHALQWNASLLFGTTHASPDRVLRAQVEYEF